MGAIVGKSFDLVWTRSESPERGGSSAGRWGWTTGGEICVRGADGMIFTAAAAPAADGVSIAFVVGGGRRVVGVRL